MNRINVLLPTHSEISPEYSLEGLMLKLKLQYFGYLIWRTDLLKRPWCWERLKAGEEGNNRGWDGWMASPTWWTWVRGLRGQGSLTCCSPWSHKESDTTEWWNWTAYSLCVCGKKIQKNPWTTKVYLASNSNIVCCLVAKSCSTLLWPHKL